MVRFWEVGSNFLRADNALLGEGPRPGRGRLLVITALPTSNRDSGSFTACEEVGFLRFARASKRVVLSDLRCEDAARVSRPVLPNEREEGALTIWPLIRLN